MQQTQKLLLLTLGVVTLSVWLQCVAAKYKINPEDLKGDVEAVSRFVTLLPSGQSNDNMAVKCNKIARLLIKANEAPSVNIVEIVQDSLLTEEEMRKSPVQPLFDKWVEYFIRAIEHMLESKNGLDKAFVPVVECADWLLGTRSILVKRYLAKEQVKTNYDQMKQLMSMKLDFFLDPNYQHPTLKLDELTAPIRLALVNWFHGNEAEMSKHFYSDDSASVEKLRQNLAAMDEKVSNVEEKMSKWNLNQQCKIYSAISEFGLGQINGSKLDAIIIAATMNNASDRKIEPPVWNPSSRDARAMVAMAKALAFQPGHQSLYAAVLNCAMKQLDGFEEVQVYLKSSEVHEMYEQLQKLANGELEDEDDDDDEDEEGGESDSEGEEEEEEEAEAEAEAGGEAKDEEEGEDEGEDEEDEGEEGEEPELDEHELSRIEQGTKGKVAQTLKNIPALIKEAQSQHPGQDGDESEDEDEDEHEDEDEDEEEADDEEDVEMSPENEQDDQQEQPAEGLKATEVEAHDHAQAKSEAEAEPESEPNAEAEADDEDQIEPEAEAEPKPTETETEAETQTQTEPEDDEEEIEHEPEHHNPTHAHAEPEAIHESHPLDTQHAVAAN